MNESQGRADATPAADPRPIALKALNDDASWLDDFGEATIQETAHRMVTIVLAALEAAGLQVVPAAEPCPDCEGVGGTSGAIPYAVARWRTPCSTCDGTGRLRGVTADRYEQDGWIGPTEQSLDAEEWWFRHEGEAADLLSDEPVYRRVSP